MVCQSLGTPITVCGWERLFSACPVLYSMAWSCRGRNLPSLPQLPSGKLPAIDPAEIQMFWLLLHTLCCFPHCSCNTRPSSAHLLRLQIEFTCSCSCCKRSRSFLRLSSNMADSDSVRLTAAASLPSTVGGAEPAAAGVCTDGNKSFRCCAPRTSSTAQCQTSVS